MSEPRVFVNERLISLILGEKGCMMAQYIWSQNNKIRLPLSPNIHWRSPMDKAFPAAEQCSWGSNAQSLLRVGGSDLTRQVGKDQPRSWQEEQRESQVVQLCVCVFHVDSLDSQADQHYRLDPMWQGQGLHVRTVRSRNWYLHLLPGWTQIEVIT
jgi:hypothetical protein